jgi:hypothetical protein
MDEAGFCPFAAVGNVAARARVTEEEAKKAIKALEGPDPESSDQDNEGRRLERVPGGWLVLNAPKYRALVTKVNIQEKVRERVRRFREKKKKSGNASVTECNASVMQSEAVSGSVTPLPPVNGGRRKTRRQTQASVGAPRSKEEEAALDAAYAEQDRQGYEMWQGMSEEYRAKNPWHGTRGAN